MASAYLSSAALKESRAFMKDFSNRSVSSMIGRLYTQPSLGPGMAAVLRHDRTAWFRHSAGPVHPDQLVPHIRHTRNSHIDSLCLSAKIRVESAKDDPSMVASAVSVEI